jgi:hypothetical protein
MNDRPSHPPTATVVCIYLVVTTFVPLPVIWILFWGWSHSVFNFPWLQLLPRSPIPIAIWALALAGAIALWQMRRAAFFLLAARLGLSLAILVIRLPRLIALFHRLSTIALHAFANSLETSGIYAAIAVQWPFDALIVWYVYRTTSPTHFHPELADPELKAESCKYEGRSIF